MSNVRNWKVVKDDMFRTKLLLVALLTGQIERTLSHSGLVPILAHNLLSKPGAIDEAGQMLLRVWVRDLKYKQQRIG